ncbi:MAG: glycosyltransferase [Candidatus Omnitrophica bacterium CG1_02_49_16]|nr:MAG: glycosyltransferase [Candidatus Omnitrophica bacterium CG1_02_49_16]
MSQDLALTVIAPVFNEEKGIDEFYKRLSEVLEGLRVPYEILFVNDGSTDRSLELLRKIRAKNVRVKILDLSRNFGHQVAIKAGIDHARGEAVVIMDSDLQDPPEEIPNFISKWKEGYDVVYGVRAHREGESLFKKWTAAIFYRLINRIAQVDIPLDAGDFRLIDRRVAQALKSIREKNPYVRGLVSWVGFRQIGVPIKRDARFAGTTKYSSHQMFKLAWNGITHFSFLPLQLSTFIGFFVSLLCLAWIVQALYVGLVLHIAVPGWTSLMVVVLFLGSVQLITLGIMGSYLARNYDESRSRPLYILKNPEDL